MTLRLNLFVALQNLDSRISERIIAKLTAQRIPVLTLHDSYIVPCGHEDYLERLMKDAFKSVLGIPLIMKRNVKGFDMPCGIKEGQERLRDLENQLMAVYMPYEELKKDQFAIEKNYCARATPMRTTRYVNNIKKYNKAIIEII